MQSGHSILYFRLNAAPYNLIPLVYPNPGIGIISIEKARQIRITAAIKILINRQSICIINTVAVRILSCERFSDISHVLYRLRQLQPQIIQPVGTYPKDLCGHQRGADLGNGIQPSVKSCRLHRKPSVRIQYLLRKRGKICFCHLSHIHNLPVVIHHLKLRRIDLHDIRNIIRGYGNIYLLRILLRIRGPYPVHLNIKRLFIIAGPDIILQGIPFRKLHARPQILYRADFHRLIITRKHIYFP